MGVRSNRFKEAYPAVWLRLLTPPRPDLAEGLARAARDTHTVLDISTQPALWGGNLWASDAAFMAIGNGQAGRATDENHAFDLTQAHILQTLSSIGRETIEFYFLPIAAGWSDFQVIGALQAVEFARQEGHIKYAGLAPGPDGRLAMGLWETRDTFDVVFAPTEEAADAIRLLAGDRGVTILHSGRKPWAQPDDVTLLGIKSLHEIPFELGRSA